MAAQELTERRARNQEQHRAMGHRPFRVVITELVVTIVGGAVLGRKLTTPHVAMSQPAAVRRTRGARRGRTRKRHSDANGGEASDRALLQGNVFTPSGRHKE